MGLSVFSKCVKQDSKIHGTVENTLDLTLADVVVLIFVVAELVEVLEAELQSKPME